MIYIFSVCRNPLLCVNLQRFVDTILRVTLWDIRIAARRKVQCVLRVFYVVLCALHMYGCVNWILVKECPEIFWQELSRTWRIALLSSEDQKSDEII